MSKLVLALLLLLSTAAAAEVSYNTVLSDFNFELAGGYIGDQAEIGHFWYSSAQLITSPLPLGLRFGVGLGVRTWSENIDRTLSWPVNFSLSAGVDVGSIRVQLRHFSNAGLHEPNWGESWVLLGWKFSGGSL